MIQALHHIGLAVGKLATAADFLQRAFGFTQTTSQQFLRTPNCYLELSEFPASASSKPDEQGVNEAGITHFCVQACQMETLYDQCANAGARFHSAPIDLGTGWLYCYARDPQANVIELEASPLAPAQQAPWLAHVAIATPNIERLASFYHRVLGGVRLGGQKIGPNPRFDLITRLPQVELIPTWIVGANLTVELWQFLSPATRPPDRLPAFEDWGYNHLCFEVAEIEQTVESFLAAGATALTPIHKDHAMTSAYLRDPDGNILELLEFSASQTTFAIAQLPDHDIVKRVANLRKL